MADSFDTVHYTKEGYVHMVSMCMGLMLRFKCYAVMVSIHSGENRDYHSIMP